MLLGETARRIHTLKRESRPRVTEGIIIMRNKNTCPECNRVFTYTKSYNKHLQSNHLGWLKYIEETPFDLQPANLPIMMTASIRDDLVNLPEDAWR